MLCKLHFPGCFAIWLLPVKSLPIGVTSDDQMVGQGVALSLILALSFLIIIGSISTVVMCPPPVSGLDCGGSFFFFFFVIVLSPSQSSVQLLSRVQLFATPWTAAHQASLSITNSQSWLNLMSIESVKSSNHLICRPSPSAFNLSQHQGLFQWVSSSYQVAKVLEFQLQHQSFQWTPRADLL